MTVKGRLQLWPTLRYELPLPAGKQPFASHHFKGLVVPLSAKSSHTTGVNFSTSYSSSRP